MDCKDVSEQTRSIIHLDLDAFFAAVEVLENPSLEGRPVLVGGEPGGRGVVAAASYEAREFGVRSAMPTYRALQLCPEAVVLPPRHHVYERFSRQVMVVVRETSPLVEQMSIDEAFIDLTGQVAAWEDGINVARDVQKRVWNEVGLSTSLGVATTKLVAKVASGRNKPGGLTVVRPGEEVAFLAPLPVRVLWGVGPVTAAKLGEMNITTVGELARAPEADLQLLFGQRGAELARQAQGIDQRRVLAEHGRRSVSQERTFAQDLRELHQLKQWLWRLSKGVARHLGNDDLAAGTVAIKLRYTDFTTLTRQMCLTVPTDDGRTIYRAALVLLERGWESGRAVRLLGVAAREVCPRTGQLPLLQD
jgi:DNA polymerase-4